jgi:hypothetical protein
MSKKTFADFMATATVQPNGLDPKLFERLASASAEKRVEIVWFVGPESATPKNSVPTTGASRRRCARRSTIYGQNFWSGRRRPRHD